MDLFSTIHCLFQFCVVTSRVAMMLTCKYKSSLCTFKGIVPHFVSTLIRFIAEN